MLLGNIISPALGSERPRQNPIEWAKSKARRILRLEIIAPQNPEPALTQIALPSPEVIKQYADDGITVPQVYDYFYEVMQRADNITPPSGILIIELPIGDVSHVIDTQTTLINKLATLNPFFVSSVIEARKRTLIVYNAMVLAAATVIPTTVPELPLPQNLLAYGNREKTKRLTAIFYEIAEPITEENEDLKISLTNIPVLRNSLSGKCLAVIVSHCWQAEQQHQPL